MSGGGGGKPQDVPVSEGEKLQAQTAKDQYAYYQQRYVPLEQRGIADAMQDHTARLVGQTSGGAMRSATGGLAAAALSHGPVDSGGLGAGLTQGYVDATAAGIRERDDRRLDMLNVGRGLSADTSKSLSDAARLQTDAAIADVQSRLAEQQAKNSTRQAIVGGLAAVGGMYGTKQLLNYQSSQQALKTSLSQGGSMAGYTSPQFQNWVTAQRAGGGR